MSIQRFTTSRLASMEAKAIYEAFEDHQTQFHAITLRAKKRFETKDWHGMQSDVTERLGLYKKVVDQVIAQLREKLEARVEDALLWSSMKAVYSTLIADRDDWEQGETFFNSVTRRIFTTVGVNAQIEFVNTDFELPPTQARYCVFRTYKWTAVTGSLIKRILSDYQFDMPYQDLEVDVQLVTAKIDAYLKSVGVENHVKQVEMVTSIFYRGQEAYLVGRLFCRGYVVPLVLVLLNGPQGIFVDAVLLSEEDISTVFSFTRSYFHVEVDRPYDLVAFLNSIMPRKRVAELYISIGFNKHGKTELYRDLLFHLSQTNSKFEVARGERGMVMAVFTLPDYDLVFKIIKDHFTYPKNTTRQEVMGKYHLVFKHDRVGRLVDAQEFEYLKFDRAHFSEELLQELLEVASQTVVVEGDWVVIKHVYLERRVTPLNLYVNEMDEVSAKAAIVDCGQAIKDLVSVNIFPGDILLKNFGVTRHGRVVFYDYDELCLLTDCKFRVIPKARYDDDEMAVEPWFAVGEHDIFPEEFPHFLKLKGALHDVFWTHHANLFDVVFWRQTQDRIKAGEPIHILPYSSSKRLERPVSNL